MVVVRRVSEDFRKKSQELHQAMERFNAFMGRTPNENFDRDRELFLARIEELAAKLRGMEAFEPCELGRRNGSAHLREPQHGASSAV